MSTQQLGWTAFLFFGVQPSVSELSPCAMPGAKRPTSSCEFCGVRGASALGPVMLNYVLPG